MEFQILEELKSFITPLSREELFTLKESILSEGCREPLVVWTKPKNENFLIDGHNRYSICNELNIPYTTRELVFKNLEEVKDWMVDNQLGRRNLTSDQLSYYRGLKYERLKQKKGGYDKILSKGHSGPLTSEVLAEEFNVSINTIKRDSQFSRGIDLIGHKNPDLKVQILSKAVKIKKNDIQFLGSIKVDGIRKFKNNADLYNELQKLKKTHVSPEEKEKQRIQEEKVMTARQHLLENDVMFKTKEEQIERSKARIVSQLNLCIRQKDHKSFKLLQQAIGNLKNLLIDS